MSQTDQPEVFAAACVQFDVHRGDVAANLAAATAGIADAAKAGARLCVLPEMWTTSFLAGFPADVLAASAAAEERLRQLSESLGVVIVGSAPEPSSAGVYNTARVFDGGRLLGVYRKIHLFSPHAEHRYHTFGEEPLLVDTQVGKLGVILCYDLRFPELARYYFQMDAEILVVPAQWPEARAQHWRTLLRARAIENEMFVLGCNRCGTETSLKTEDELTFPGDGRIVDPMGEVLVGGTGEAGPLVAEIELRKVRTMRRILPVGRDQRPSVYRRLLEAAWPRMQEQSREGDGSDGT